MRSTIFKFSSYGWPPKYRYKEGIISGGFRFVDCDFEHEYSGQLKEHVRMLSIRQLVPAEPGDPDGFFVMWECDAKRRQQVKEQGKE